VNQATCFTSPVGTPAERARPGAPGEWYVSNMFGNYFQLVPGGRKFLAVFAGCLLSALALNALNAEALPADWPSWRAFALTVFMTGLAIAIGSQVFHVLIKQYVPWAAGWLAELLKALKVPTTDSSVG
jgi:hypothetical protein